MELGPEDVSLLERCEAGMCRLTCKQGTVARLRSKAPVTSSPTLYDGLKNDNLPMTPLGFLSV